MNALNRRNFFGSLMAGAAVVGGSQVLAQTTAPGPARPEPQQTVPDGTGPTPDQQMPGEQRAGEAPFDPYSQTMRKLSATFYGVPFVEKIEQLNAQVAFVGVPFDLGTTFRPGARFGPQGLRRAARGGYDAKTLPGYYDYEEGERYLKGVTMADVGDVAIMPADFMPNFDRITGELKKVVAKQAMPVILGGDHSITFPVMRAFEGIKDKIYIIHFDSHLDFSDGRGAVRLAHGNPLRRSIELPWIGGLTSLGIRGMAGNTKTYEEGQKMGVQVIPALKMIKMGIKEAIASIPKRENYYITFDVDVIDPSLSPATGTPVPGGFTYYQAKEALQEIAKKGKIVGFEFVEVAPEYDFAETTSRLSARLMLDFLAAIFKYQADKYPPAKPQSA